LQGCPFYSLCEIRYCALNVQKIISPANKSLPVLTANDKITWWLRPQTPSEKSWIDFLKDDIRIIEITWKRYQNMKRKRELKLSKKSLKEEICSIYIF